MQTMRTEFIGGPYDGYADQMYIAGHRLGETIELPENPAILAALTGEEVEEIFPTNVVAIYQLHATVDNKELRYTFVGSIEMPSSKLIRKKFDRMTRHFYKAFKSMNAKAAQNDQSGPTLLSE